MMRIKRRSKAACLLAVGSAVTLFAASPVSGQTIFEFGFDEGTGTTVTDSTSGLVGNFGRPIDPVSYPVANADSPSGGAADQSLTIIDPEGYLLVDTSEVAEFSDLTKPITAEAWINIPITAAARAEAVVGYGGSWKLGLRPSGTLAFTLFGVIDADSLILPNIGVWTHIAAVWEPGVGVTFFVDGVESGFVDEVRPANPPNYDFLGVGSAGRGEPINASIDRVRVHQAKLTAEELDSDPANPKANLTSTLAAFTFNETTPPFRSTGLLDEAAVFAQDVYTAEITPRFISDSPSQQVGDGSIEFDGNDRVRFEDPTGLVTLPTGDFTVQGWVKFADQPMARSVLFFNNGPGGAISFSVTSDRRVHVTTLGIADTPSDAFVPNDGLWHHIAVIHRNGQDLRFFVDGVLGDTIPYTGGVITTRLDAFFFLGSEPTGNFPYQGSLDRFQLSSEAIAPSELDFLAIPGVVPGAPTLEISTATAIAWPTESTGFTLQSSTDLNEPRTWTNVPVAPVVMGTDYYVLLPTPEQKTFYRLVRPQAEE